jgi:hypothetical protein
MVICICILNYVRIRERISLRLALDKKCKALPKKLLIKRLETSDESALPSKYQALSSKNQYSQKLQSSE